MKRKPAARDVPTRRTYARQAVEITSIEFVPMTEEERKKAIAALVELFMPLVHGSTEETDIAA